MTEDRSTPCPDQHIEGASEWHKDGKLCDEWLRNLERGRFSQERCALIRRVVMSDQVGRLNRFDAGELIRLDVSLSRTLPPKMGFLKAASASFGKVRGKVRFADEYRDGILS